VHKTSAAVSRNDTCPCGALGASFKEVLCGYGKSVDTANPQQFIDFAQQLLPGFFFHDALDETYGEESLDLSLARKRVRSESGVHGIYDLVLGTSGLCPTGRSLEFF